MRRNAIRFLLFLALGVSLLATAPAFASDGGSDVGLPSEDTKASVEQSKSDGQASETAGSSGESSDSSYRMEGVNLDALPPSDPSAAPSFTDVLPNDWFREAVAWAVSSGVTNGTSSTTFSPNADCNRAQMVTFLWRAAGSPAPESGDASKFTDVKSSDYFAQAVAWAVENGVTNGTGDAAFSPYSPVTRAQAVTFLWRAQGRPAAAAGESYADVEAGSFYADAVRWAAAKNVTKGTGESTFSPSTTVNRAMSVTFLYRAYGVT